MGRPSGRLGRGFVAVMALFALASGCGKPITGHVTGRVVQNGKPVPGGQIAFIGANGIPVCATIADGAYRADGVPTGPMFITVFVSVGEPPDPDPLARAPAKKK